MELLQLRRGASRWVYIGSGAVVLFLLSFGLEHGLSEVWLFVVLLGVCTVQTVYPTLLGWMLIFIPFAGYTLLIASSLGSTPLDNEYLMFLAVGAVPTCLLLLCRPKRRDVTKPSR